MVNLDKFRLENLSEIEKGDKLIIITRKGFAMYGKVSNFDGANLELQPTGKLRCPYTKNKESYHIKLSKFMDVYRV